MSASEPQTIPFDGVRLRFGSTKSFDDLVDAVLADVGREPVPIDDIAKQFEQLGVLRDTRCNPTSAQAVSCCSALSTTAGGLRKTGIQRKVLRLVIGNPLIAITMMRHDVTAGLFAPVELLLTEEENGTSALTYVVPSSLMVVEPNPPLLAAAQELDAKLAALATKVTARLSQRRELRRHVVQPSKRLVARLGRKLHHDPLDAEGCVAFHVSAVSSPNWVTVTGTSLPATACNSSSWPERTSGDGAIAIHPAFSRAMRRNDRRSPATDVQRRIGLRHGLGPAEDRVEIDEFSVEFGFVLRPDRNHRVQPLVGHAPAHRGIDTVVGDFLAVPAHAHAEQEPSCRDSIERRDLFGRDDRIALRDQGDAGTEHQLFGGTRGRRQRHETDPVSGSTSAESGHPSGKGSRC